MKKLVLLASLVIANASSTYSQSANKELSYVEITDLLTKASKVIEDFPDESVLKENTILVVTAKYNGTEEFEKELKKVYPYEYKAIGKDDIAKYAESGTYKYALVGHSYWGVATSGSGTSHGRSSSVLMYYYVLKDIETLECYYFTTEKKCLKNGTQYDWVALRKSLKMMKKHYEWGK